MSRKNEKNFRISSKINLVNFKNKVQDGRADYNWDCCAKKKEGYDFSLDELNIWKIFAGNPFALLSSNSFLEKISTCTNT